MMLVIAGLLGGGMLLTEENTPRLGIDLAGGTSITLTATADERNKDAVNPTNLDTAVGIIERRVNGLGVSEAEVQTQGDRNIVINIPKGTDETQARQQVGTTAQLGFRPVWAAEQVGLPPGEQDPGAEDPEAEDPDADPDAEDPDAEDPDAEGSGDTDGEGTDATDPDAADTGDGTEDEADRSDRSSGRDQSSLGAPSGVAEAGHASLRTQDDEETDPPAEGEEGEEGEETGEPGEPVPGALAAELAALDCVTPEGRLAASNAAAEAEETEAVVTCDREGFFKYELGPVAVPGTDVSSADSRYDTEQGLGWIVVMEFNSAGGKKFADITSELSTQAPPRNQFAIVLDGETVSAPRVSERLGGGSATISGSFNQESAGDLANVLKYGALPITFEEANVVTISATLGDEQLKAGLIAGGIGLILVFGYLIFYYRALALIAIGSLAAMALLTYAIMTLLGPGIGFALSLPAVCGAIVAIGITADSFIVYFERIRDEVREGRPIRAAIERAWPRARRTILVSDVVSFLAAIVLFIVSVGTVQGFAFVLGLTTALDVVIVFLLTKPLVTLAARRKFFARGHKWSGLDPKRLGARPPIRRTTGRRVTVPADPKEA
jgi:preprotein translocase subunit SecD